MTSPGEGVTVFTSPYLNAGAPAPGEAKWLIKPKIEKEKETLENYIIEYLKKLFGNWIYLIYIDCKNGFLNYLNNNKDFNVDLNTDLIVL